MAKTAWVRRIRHTWIWRQACAFAAALNIIVLMAANLVGFVVGVDGVRPLLGKLVEEPWFAAKVLATLFAAVQLQFKLREWEAGYLSGYSR